MHTWIYLNNTEYRYLPTCPYCGKALNMLTKSFEIEFKTPKIPPIGSKDLNLFDITYKTYSKEYFICANCEAKYDYDNMSKISYLRALAAIPSSTSLLNNYIDNELPNYPSNTIYKVIWRKNVYKKGSNRKLHSIFSINFYKSINLLFSKLYYTFQNLVGIFTSR